MHQDFGQLLRIHRKDNAITLQAMSQMAGIAIPTIRLLETGRGNINSFLKCLDALALRMHWLNIDERNPGDALASRRRMLDISQRDLAKQIGVSHRTIIALENHFRGRLDTLTACLSALRLKPSLITTDRIKEPLSGDVMNHNGLLSVLQSGEENDPNYALLQGDAHSTLSSLPSETIDCIITSPPYWGQRVYKAGGIGQEPTVEAYLKDLRAVFRQAHRVLKARGSLWLNIDDSYSNSSMLGIPWRLVLGMVEDCGWLVRNDVIWSKTGGSLNRSTNRLTHRHEHIFHLVKQPDYWFDDDAIRVPPALARLGAGEVATATGLTKSACLTRIDQADLLTDGQRHAARSSVTNAFDDLAHGRLHDFRLVIKGQNRTTHSDEQSSSSRAERLDRDGFYILRYDPKGSMPGDVWYLSPERSTGRTAHYAPFPETICDIPLKATCPIGGIVLDPFVGTGTTLVAAQRLGRSGIGIDLSKSYLDTTSDRLRASRQYNDR
ncbi:DNA methyltransferase [Cognatishimia sp. MH4019]|uniref:DNA methyltransferase n=1 Tax=Cognatishimia sp. MH4019 TaxID=2854030 RepID=UPI001CD7A995|nr:DNA methyltransferase [Cognatishimia sp. MH4019]